MRSNTQPTFSEFPPLQGLWTPRSLDDCGEVLDHLRILPQIPVGILFLCFTGMRDLESWFSEGMSRPKRTCTVLALDQPQAHVNGSELVDAVGAFENDEATVIGWTQLCALTLWSELRGAEVSCLWTEQALRVLLGANTPEVIFFPWSSPVWQHSLAPSIPGEFGFDPHEMAVRRGLNPSLIRGLAQVDRPSAELNASHFSRARAILNHREKVAPIRNFGAHLWRLDRYFNPDATGSSLGVAIETRRFRASLFEWLRDSNHDDDENLLTVDALLHLREQTPCTAVSCNSFIFRWRTRNPFSYQYLTLGELHQVLSLLGRKQENSFVGYMSDRSKPSIGSGIFAFGARKSPIVTHQFQFDLHDNHIVSGLISRVPAHTIGEGLYPDIVRTDYPKPLSAIVEDYEKATSKRVIVAINGGYFLDTRTVPRDHPDWLGMPVGLLKCNDQVISGPFYTNRPVFCLDHENKIALRFISKGICTQENASLAEAYKWSDLSDEYMGFRAAIEAGPLLIKAGSPDLDLDREQWGSPSARAIQSAPVELPDLRTQRTAIVMSRTGDVHLVTVHGRVPESAGMTHEELANWLHHEVPEVDWAMELDAGGSVTAWHANVGVTTIGSCFGGRERPIASAILFSISPNE